MSPSALRIDRVTKRYGEFTAVDALSLDVPAGTVYGILGPNGAGKTTTLRMVNDIIAPDEGTITILERYRPGHDAVGRVGYLPEERGLYPKMRVIEVLRFFGELRALTGREATRRAERVLGRLELADWKPAKPQGLYQGTRQKIQSERSA